MKHSIHLPLIAFVAVLAVFGGMGLAANAKEGRVAEARDMIAGTGDEVLLVLGNKWRPKAEREAQFRRIYHKIFDDETIAADVMGRLWPAAAPAQRRAFRQVLETYIVKVFVARFAAYSGEKFTVTKSEPAENGINVVSEIIDPRLRDKGMVPVLLQWRLHEVDGKLWVRDMVVENVSLSLNLRRELTADSRQRGGTVEGMIAALRDKIAGLD